MSNFLCEVSTLEKWQHLRDLLIKFQEKHSHDTLGHYQPFRDTLDQLRDLLHPRREELWTTRPTSGQN